MDVHSAFNIYANLFGWHVYDMLYDFLKISGLWLIPVFIIFYNVLFGNRGFGEVKQYNAKGALASLEMNVYSLVLVLGLFFIPTVPLDKLNLEYYDGTDTKTAGATDTGFDSYSANLPDTVTIPAGWYLIMRATSALNTVIKDILPTGDNLRGIMYEMQSLAIDDQGLREELQNFNTSCAKPARARYHVMLRDRPDSQISTLIKDRISLVTNRNLPEEAWIIDTLYPGNLLFQQYLYQDNHCPTPTTAVPNPENLNVCLPGTGIAVTPPPEKVSCNEWWVGSGDLFGRLVGEFKTLPNWLGTTEGKNNLLRNRLNSANTQMSELGLGNKDGVGGMVQWLQEKFVAFSANTGNFFMSFANTVIRFYLPIALGLMTMLIVMLLPLFMVLSKYAIPTVASIAILYFGINLLPGIWHIATWVDQVMISALWGQQGAIEGFFSMRQAVWGLIAMTIYLGFAFFWINYMRSVGAAGGLAIQGAINDAGSSGAGATGVMKGGARTGMNYARNKISPQKK